jgi:uncharacterized membrane protein YccF (DUF307 family)
VGAASATASAAGAVVLERRMHLWMIASWSVESQSQTAENAIHPGVMFYVLCVMWYVVCGMWYVLCVVAYGIWHMAYGI